MVLESSISSPDNDMAKELAINSTVKTASTQESGLKTKILKGLAALGIVTAFSSTVNAQEGVAKNQDKFPQGVIQKYEAPKAKDTNTVGTYKIEEPIKDSVEFKKVRDEAINDRDKAMGDIEQQKKLTKEWKELQIKIDQFNMLNGPFNFFKKLKVNGDVMTERDGQKARTALEILRSTKFIDDPQIQKSYKQAEAMLLYLIKIAPQSPSIVKSN